MQISERERLLGIARGCQWSVDSLELDFDTGLPKRLVLKQESNPYLPELFEMFPRVEVSDE